MKVCVCRGEGGGSYKPSWLQAHCEVVLHSRSVCTQIQTLKIPYQHLHIIHFLLQFGYVLQCCLLRTLRLSQLLLNYWYHHYHIHVGKVNDDSKQYANVYIHVWKLATALTAKCLS